MASPNVAPVLAKELVGLKLESDRMVGGIPWFVVLDGDGIAGVTSDGPKGNVGFPAAPREIAHFRTMLERSKRKLTDADINALVRSLEDAGQK